MDPFGTGSRVAYGLQGCLATASPGLGFYRLTSSIVRVDSLQNGGGKLETLGRASPFGGALPEPGQRGGIICLGAHSEEIFPDPELGPQFSISYICGEEELMTAEI